jgi:H+/Cl- antiporter ClcA
MVLVEMAVIVESVEMNMLIVVMMVVVLIIKVVLGALTESPIYPDLATHRLAPSIPAPPMHPT